MSTSTKSISSYPSQKRNPSTMSVGSDRSWKSSTVNFFEIGLKTMCTKYKTNSTQYVKINSATNFVEIIGDRMEVKDWQAVLEAISNDTSTSHLRIKNRRYIVSLDKNYDSLSSVLDAPKHVPTMGTLYVAREIATSVREMLVNTTALVYLELENVLLDEQAVEALAAGVAANRTLEYLSLARSRMGDRACSMLCRVLRNKPNVMSVNLSGCSLTRAAASGITDMVKRQQTRRNEECWAHSLRFRTANPDVMHGLRRITLNENTGLGDRGLADLLESLKDDLYVKALDVQNCGLTDHGARLALSMLAVNDTLVVLDVRRNDQVSGPLLAAIMSRLYENHKGNSNVDQWKWTKLRRPANGSLASSTSSGAFSMKTTPSSLKLKK